MLLKNTIRLSKNTWPRRLKDNSRKVYFTARNVVPFTKLAIIVISCFTSTVFAQSNISKHLDSTFSTVQKNEELNIQDQISQENLREDRIRVANHHHNRFDCPDISLQERNKAIEEIKVLLKSLDKEINADFSERLHNQKVHELQKNLIAHDNHGNLVLDANGNPLTIEDVAACIDDCDFTSSPNLDDPSILAAYINKHIVSKTLHGKDDNCNIFVPAEVEKQLHSYTNADSEQTSSCVEICRQDMLHKVDGQGLIKILQQSEQISKPSVYVADNALNNAIIEQYIKGENVDNSENNQQLTKEEHIALHKKENTPLVSNCHVMPSTSGEIKNAHYFNYQLDQCWVETMPIYDNDHELYALFNNSCQSTTVEISVIKDAKASLKDYVKEAYESLSTFPADFPNENPYGYYVMQYKVLGIPSVNYFTSNGKDIASIVITGNISQGISFINGFKVVDHALFPKIQEQKFSSTSSPDIIGIHKTFADLNKDTLQVN